MFIFIVLNLCIGFFLEYESFFRSFLLSSYSLYIGVFLLVGGLITSYYKVKIIYFKLRYDLFALGSLLVWTSYWPPFFRVGSPVFLYFPFYFAFITALFSIIFITRQENIDPDALNFLQWLSDSGRFNPIVIMIAVMISLTMPKHFIFFPAMMTLLVMRFALASCLDNE